MSFHTRNKRSLSQAYEEEESISSSGSFAKKQKIDTQHNYFACSSGELLDFLFFSYLLDVLPVLLFVCKEWKSVVSKGASLKARDIPLSISWARLIGFALSLGKSSPLFAWTGALNIRVFCRLMPCNKLCLFYR